MLGPGQGKLLKLEDIGAWSSTISSNTTWSGNYSINANVTVNNNITLTVSPGANVQFGSAKSLTINGKLVADSNNPNQRITFSGASSTPGFWSGLAINSGSSSNASTLRRCEVQYAVDGVKITYTGNSNNVTIDKCTLRHNASAGLYVNGNGYSGATVHPLVRRSTISNNGNDGVYLTNYAKPTIAFNRLENNSASGLFASSNCPAKVDSNFVSGNAEYGLWFSLSSSVELNRNTIKNNSGRGVYCASTSNVIAYGAGNGKGRNEITGNSTQGIYAGSSSPIFGKDVANEYGNNWIHDNSSYEAQQSGSGYQLRAERCYWSGQQGNISGNVDNSPTLGSAPNPVGWGQNDTYDPTYLMRKNPDITMEITSPGRQSENLPERLLTNSGANGLFGFRTEDLKAALEEGLATGDWSKASEVITSLHRELQEARVPEIDFAMVEDHANRLEVASFIRKMLALLLMEKDLIENKLAGALSKLDAFQRNNAGQAAELLTNAGLIHLYRQNDLTAAANVLAQLQNMAKNGDASAPDNAEAFARILHYYRSDQKLDDSGLQKALQTSSARDSVLPEKTQLSQNYPNPFNPETTIRFHVSGQEAKEVSLIIFNMLGQPVRTLAIGKQNPGNHTVQWDGRDNFGQELPSGTYLLRVNIGKQILKRKLMLLR